MKQNQNEQGLPPGWRTIKLSDILTTKQLLQASVYIKRGQKAELRAWLNEPALKAQLLEKGVISDYLFYYLLYKLAPVQ